MEISDLTLRSVGLESLDYRALDEKAPTLPTSDSLLPDGRPIVSELVILHERYVGQTDRFIHSQLQPNISNPHLRRPQDFNRVMEQVTQILKRQVHITGDNAMRDVVLLLEIIKSDNELIQIGIWLLVKV